MLHKYTNPQIRIITRPPHAATIAGPDVEAHRVAILATLAADAKEPGSMIAAIGASLAGSFIFLTVEPMATADAESATADALARLAYTAIRTAPPAP